MVLEVNKEQLALNKLICEKTETIIVQGDMIVPDSKPDILNTINASGVVSIYKKETMDGKVRLDGTITTYIMYMPDNSEDKVRGISTTLDFSESFMIPECKNGMNPIVNAKIKSIDCRVLNGRKISIKVGLETTLQIFESEDIAVISNIEDDEIQMLRPSYTINTLVGEGEAKANVKENISIENADNLAEILKVNMNIVDKDIKVSYNKVLAKSEIEMQIMYLTEDNRINTVTSKLPVVGFVDIQNISEEDICDTSFEVRNIVINPNNVEDHSIYVEVDVSIICRAFNEKEISLIEDMYSTNKEITFNSRTVTTMANKRMYKQNYNFREKINIPEISNGQVVNADIEPVIIKENKMNGKIMYECEADVVVTYTNTSSIGINTKNIKIPFECTIENENIQNNSKIKTNIEVASKEINVGQGGEININSDFIFDMNMYENQNVDIIEDVEEEEEGLMQDYSVIIYIVKKGDTLWNIAKRFKTTVDDIARVNGIENPNMIYAGEKIYIPRTVKVSASYV